jgi:trk system potassium uptake protein TrkH
LSGVTTTGLTTTATVADKPVGFLFARAWLQWYGGLGIVVLSAALVMRPGPALRRLASSEDTSNDLAVDARAHARRMLMIYGALTTATLLALFMIGLSPLAAISCALSAVSTGGFAANDASLAAVAGWPGRFTILACALLAAGSFPAYYRWVRGRSGRTPWDETAGWALLVFTLIISLALALLLHFQRRVGWPGSICHGLGLGISTQSTTGFSTLNIEALPPAAKAMQIVSMFIGGDLGSTAGGIKVFRFLITLRVLEHWLARTSVTRHTVLPRRLGQHKLADGVALDATLLISLFTGTIVVSWIVFLCYGFDPLNALYDVVSATATVGLSTGVTGPTLPVPLKLVLCADMLLGWIEIIAVLVLFYPRTWFGKRARIS